MASPKYNDDTADATRRARAVDEGQPRSARPLGFWQRRYVLAHYGHCDDEALAAATGCRAGAITAYLAWRGATRSPSQLRAIERLRGEPVPELSCPSAVRALLTRLKSRPLTRVDGVLVAAMFLGSVALYATTAARTVTGEDAGELLGAAHGFGVPHPPGYPLWLLLAWIADHALPFGTVAFRITLVSVLPSAAANALLLAVTLKTVRSRLAACIGSALFALSLTHWTQAVIPEVYGLNTFFVALCALLVVRLAERPTALRLLALAGTAGLACTNHTTALPVAVVLAIAPCTIAPQLLKRPVLVAGVLLAGLAPLALFLVLPLASARQPYVDWGNPETMPALWAHASRAQYAAVEPSRRAASDDGAFAADTEHSDYLRRLSIMAHWMGRQFGTPWVLALSVLGLVALFARQTGLWLLMIGVGWLCSVGITQYTQFPFEREHMYAVQIFYIPAWLVLGWLAAGGLDEIVALVRHRFASFARPALASLGALSLAGLLVLGVHDARIADRSQTTAIADFGKAVLDTMEPGALYFPASDHSTFAVMYWQGVQGYRADVVIADKYGRIEPDFAESYLTPADHEQLARTPPADQRPIVEAALIRHWPGPVYFANRREMGDISELRLEPCGPIFKVMTPEQASAWWKVPDDGTIAAGLAIWDRFDALTVLEERQHVDFTVQMVRGDMLYMKGFAQLCAGRLDDANATWSEIGADLAPLKQTYNNIGSALAEHARLAEALPFYHKALDEDPRYVLGLRNQALVQRDLGNTAGAIDSLRQLLAIDDSHKGAHLELAKLLERQNDVTGALTQYEALAVLDGNDALPWSEAGSLLLQIGDLRKAETALTESLKRRADQPRVAEMLERIRRGVPLMAANQDPLIDFSQPAEAPSGPPPMWNSVATDPNLPRLPNLPGLGGPQAMPVEPNPGIGGGP